MKETYRTSNTISEVDGAPAVVLSFLKKNDANTVQTANNISDAMDDYKELPKGVSMNTVLDTSEFIKISINTVFWNIIIGGIFSVLVLLLFLKSVRATIVIGLSIPIAIISTFTLMYFTGETLNVLTMGGLALGIGMMVDSSIVILENIVIYREQGYSMVEAAKIGASELAPAVIASATTTLVVFLPIIFIEWDRFGAVYAACFNHIVCADRLACRIGHVNSDAFLETFNESLEEQRAPLLV